MTVQTKTTLKSYFNTGDTPTESNFSDFIDTIGQASLTVAASNASNASKGRADYVCDGTADEVEINAALAALPASGGHVWLTEGLFTLADGGSGYCIYLNYSNVALHLNPGTTLKLRDNEISGTETCNLIRIGVKDNILIDGNGGVIDGNRSNNISTGDINGGAAIYGVSRERNLWIRDLTIQNISRDAIFLTGGGDGDSRSTNIKIENCKIFNCAEGIVFQYSYYTWIDRCVIDTIDEQDGIEPGSYNDYFWITDCYITGVSSVNNGIEIYGGVGACRNGVICGNVITAGGSDYYITAGEAGVGTISNILIADNILVSGGIRMGVGASGTSVAILSNNILTGLDGIGIAIGANGTGIIIDDNYINGFATAISNSGTATIHDNTGYTTENKGAATNVADGGTIAHGCIATPTVVIVSASVAGEFASVIGINATNITVAIKKHDNSAGTSQTIYWRAYV